MVEKATNASGGGRGRDERSSWPRAIATRSGAIGTRTRKELLALLGARSYSKGHRYCFAINLDDLMTLPATRPKEGPCHGGPHGRGLATLFARARAFARR